jgi:cysteine desulfurase
MRLQAGVYLRHASTTPLDPRVRDRVISCLDEDPRIEGSLLADGRRARRILDEARERIALLIGAAGEELVLTSGGTEASNLALKGVALAPGGGGKDRRRILVAATESFSIHHPARTLGRLGFDVEEIPVGREGLLDRDRLASMLDDRVLLVSVGVANSETGVIQEIPSISKQVHESGAILHSDASIAAAHLPLDVGDLGVDLMSLSAHRMYGPRGAGALFVRKGIRLVPLIEGGVDEGGLRGGTPPVALLSGFGEAAALAMVERASWAERSWETGRLILEGLLRSIPGLVHNGAGAGRIEAMASLSVEGVEGESLLLDLGRAGIAASSGSSCFDEAGVPSHVLLAMGISPRMAQSSVLLSAGRDTTQDDVERVLAVLPAAVTRLRALAVAVVR